MVDINAGEVFRPCPVIHFIPQLQQYIFNPDVVIPIYKIPSKKGTLTTTGQSTNFICGINLVSEE